MKHLNVILLSQIIVTQSALGLLFPRSDLNILQSTTSDQPPNIAKFIRKSEDTLRWLGNKTAGSLNGFFNLKNQTSNFQPTNPPIVDSKKNFLVWLKNKIHFKSSSSFDYSEDPEEDSGDSLVIAHRTRDQGFSWGPTEKNDSHDAPVAAGPLRTSIHYVKDAVLTFVLRSYIFIKETISSVFAKRIPYLAWQYTPDAIKRRMANFKHVQPGNNNASECDETVKPTCAVDEEKRYTVFQNECKMAQFNFQHGFNFSVRSNDVCLDLIARHPEQFYKI